MDYSATNNYEESKNRNIDNDSWYIETGLKSTYPVGSKKPNAWGIYDMVGNVSEWCDNWYESFFYRRFAFWEEKNPTGPATPNHV